MKTKKQVLMVMPVMKGGGAERVAALLMNEFYKNKYDVKFLLTSSKREDVVDRDLDKNIPIITLEQKKPDAKMKLLKVYASFWCRAFESLKIPVSSHFAYCSFVSQYGNEIKQLRAMMKDNPDMTVITFLQPSIPMVLLAGQGLENKILFSERGNPGRLMRHRYGRKFIEKYYRRADVAVFQTREAKESYPEIIGKKGVVISNPIRDSLPKPYVGERNKKITTFCRISKQKNLPMLVDAFALLHKEHPEYVLRIIGDAITEEGEQVLEELKKQIHALELEESIEWCPFSMNVHEEILEDAMYVNSSDYEGISNAMLEAMAIGMPVVCTDCPIGGAHATIENEINGLLVPVGDADALHLAMKKIVEKPEFAKSLSKEAGKLRDILSLEAIAKQWMELI